MKPINPGDFKQRLTFLKPSSSKNENGFRENKPTEYTKAWAKLKTLKGKAFYAAASSNMEHNRNFTIRYQRKLEDGVRPKGLIVMWKNANHEIISIENDDGLNVTMTVVLKAVS